MNKALSIILYAGDGKEELETLKAEYVEQNRRNLFWYGMVVMAFFGVLGAIVFLKNGIFVENTAFYFGTAAVMALIMVCARLLNRQNYKEAYVRVLMYSFMAVLYAEATLVTLGHPDLPAVTFIGILMVLPLLFIDRPIIIMLAQTVFVAGFCLIAAKYKNPDISTTDIWNGITFLVASWAEILIIIPMRITSMKRTKQVEFLSRNDLLTGSLNRNAYEEHIKEISEKADETLVCVYTDANGLHEMNDTLGHEAGDHMLKTISRELMNAFGPDETYRIGGDEFVVLSVNRTSETVLQRLYDIQNTLLAKQYFVSIGMSAIADHDMDVQSTIKDAEQRMYEAKKQFYTESVRDRRKRNRTS